MNRLHKRNRRRRVIWTIVSIATISFLLFLMIRTLVKNEDLKENRIITIGVVTGTSSNQRNTGGGLKYTFSVNGKTYKGSTAYPELNISFCETLIGRTFPIIYSPKDVNNNNMLLTNKTFLIYGIEQPDSLKWVEQYVRKR